ncbi:MAG: SDR family oxidoreductase [Deltaproteobacteria bacterium]|nr:SDR family oxidoreductase [Deltaproteobacteria bacterium]
MGLLDDRVAVVTGAGRGIGQAIAVVFVKEGAKVVINDLEEGPVQETLELCQDAGGRAAASIGSVVDPAYTDQLMKTAVDEFAKLDILINNAGVTKDSVIHRMSDEQWALVLDVNLRGTFNCIRSTAPYMRDVAKQEMDSEGDVRYHRKIVNFFSTACVRGNPGQINYTAAKMGNIGITRTVAQEWARFKINVNAVGPGFTDTRMTKPKEEMVAKGEPNMGIPSAQRDAAIARIPFGRPAAPEEIGKVCLFFASHLSDYVTGQDINVSGGYQIP